MENLKKLKPTKELWIKIKWILSHSKPIIPFLIFSIIINVMFSLIGIYNVVVSKSLIDSAISGDSQGTIKWIIVMLTITIISMLSSPVTSFMSTHSSTKLNQNIQRKIYKHIEYSDWLGQSKFHSVSLLTRITSDVGTISSALLGTIPSLVSIAVTLIGSFYTLINWAPSIAFVAIFIGPFLVIVGRIFSRKLKAIYKEAQEIDVKYRSFMQESMQNIMIIKTFCMEKINMNKLIGIQNEKYRIAMRNTKLSVMTSMSMSFCSSFAYFSIFTWGVLNIAKGVTTYGTFTGMLQLYSKVQSPFSSLANMIPGLISTIAAAERLMEIEAIPLEKNSKAEFEVAEVGVDSNSFKKKKKHSNKNAEEVINTSDMAINTEAYGQAAITREIDSQSDSEKQLDSEAITNTFSMPYLFKKPQIEFRNVSFGYKENTTVLNDIDLTIEPGETIAFVGPSGEGKTTMIRLILSLINPSKGEVVLTEDGVSKIIDRNYRELISYVPQGNTLFSGSIEDNLKYGNPTASKEELYKSLEDACALDFVNELEDGLNTLIGERGVGISEGQAQRVGIARSFLRKRPILILDEATSALDPETEVKVLKAVKALPTKPTCIIITHRPSALNICNRIVRLEKGHLKEVTKESILDISEELV